MFSYFFCRWHTRVFHNMCPFCLVAFSFEFDLRVICDVATELTVIILFPFFRILVERTQTIIMNGVRTVMDLISACVDITNIEGWPYGYVVSLTPCRVKPDSGTLTSKRYTLWSRRTWIFSPVVKDSMYPPWFSKTTRLPLSQIRLTDTNGRWTSVTWALKAIS